MSDTAVSVPGVSGKPWALTQGLTHKPASAIARKEIKEAETRPVVKRMT
ncbi:hypothetical protein [Acidovorax sp. KKS102]|nr:hypothetical protein [Acidovorax sp. KKS102]